MLLCFQMISVLMENLSSAEDKFENSAVHRQFLAKFRKRARGAGNKVDFDKEHVSLLFTLLDNHVLNFNLENVHPFYTEIIWFSMQTLHREPICKALTLGSYVAKALSCIPIL